MITSNQLQNACAILTAKYYNFDPGVRVQSMMLEQLKDCEYQDLLAVVSDCLLSSPLASPQPSDICKKTLEISNKRKSKTQDAISANILQQAVLGLEHVKALLEGK